MGFYSLQTGRSYINIKNNESTKDLVATSATESQRAMDHQRGIDFLQNEDDHSTYSRNFGNAVARYYGYALSSYGSGYGSAKINNPSSINQNYYASNNKEFSRLDKQKGANRQLHQAEEDFILKNSEEYAHTKGISREKAYEILNIAARIMVDKDTNDFINSRENASFEMENGEEPITKNLNEDERGYNLSDLRQAEEYLAKKSDGLDFFDWYGNDGAKKSVKTNYFTTNSWREYADEDWNPNHGRGMIDVSDITFPMAGIFSKLNLSKAIGKTEVTGVSAIIGNTAKGAGTKETKGVIASAYDKAGEAIFSSVAKLSSQPPINTIKIANKEYAVVGMDKLTKSPIIREVKNDVLVGNHYIVYQEGLISIGKNALRRTNTKVLSKEEFTNILKSRTNPVEDTLKYQKQFSEFVNSYVPSGIPEGTKFGFCGWAASGPRGQIIDTYDFFSDKLENVIDKINHNEKEQQNVR